MDANIDLRDDRNRTLRSKAALFDMIEEFTLQLDYVKDSKAYTWAKDRSKNKTLTGYLDFILSKNVNIQLLELGTFLGNSDHKTLNVKI